MTFGAICLEHKLGGSVVEPIVRRYTAISLNLLLDSPFIFIFPPYLIAIFFRINRIAYMISC
jgi:hypothetical protein